MNLKNCPIIFVLLILGFSCSKKEEIASGRAKKAVPQIKSHFLINSLGDTVPTGVPIFANGKRIDPDSVAKPEVVSFRGSPRVEPAHTNVLPAGQPKVVSIPKGLPKITPGKNGVPLPDTFLSNKIDIPTSLSKPLLASPPVMRENAIANLQYIGAGEGLSDHGAFSILMDSRGHLWFGNDDGTLNRYDGHQLDFFPDHKDLPEHRHILRSLIEDDQGNLWFGTYSGIGRYNGNKFTYYSNQYAFNYKGVNALLKDKQGMLWFGTEEGGVGRFDGQHFIHYTTKEGLSHNKVNAILEDSHGDLWFGTHGGGLSQYDGQSFIHYSTKEGLVNNIVLAAFKDSQGNLWFGTNGGMSRYNGKSFTSYTLEEGLDINQINAISEDKQGDLWIGGSKNTLVKFDGRTFTHYNQENGMNSGSGRAVLADNYNNIWLGTWEGVHFFGVHQFRHFYQELDLEDVNGILEDHKGNLWFITQNRQLIRYDGKTFTYLTQNEGLNGFNISSNYEDHKGNFWLGTNGGGAIYYEPNEEGWEGRLTYYSKKEGLSSNYIRSILEDSQKHLWFATANGLNHYDGKNFVHYTQEQGVIMDAVTTLVEDSKHNIWFGTRTFLARFDGKAFTFFTRNEGLPDNWIHSLIIDREDKLWVGTDGGLSQFDGERFLNFTEKEGLINNRVLALLEDNDKNIWASTQNGLSLLIPDTPDNLTINEKGVPGYKIYNFVKGDGLRHSDFWRNGVCLDSKNRVWWGKTKGVTMLNLDQFKFPDNPAKIHLDHIEINQQFIDFRRLVDTTYYETISFGETLSHSFDSVAAFFNYPVNMTLPYHLNHLTFHFSAIDWAGPHKLQYSYKIKGLDKNWSLPQSEPKAEYRNLPHGKHTLQVKAIGAAQVWSEPFEYTFTVHPPWWYTWWAYSLYVLIGLLLLTGLFLYQRRRWQLQTRLEVEEEKAERLKELDQFKSRFYTNITHEFRTPLTVIKGMAGQIAGQENVRKMIQRNSNRLLSLVNQLLDLSKLETKSLNIDWVQGDVIPHLQYLTESCHSLAESKSINLAFFSKEESLEMDFDENKLQQILINLLSNAIKFTPEYGSVKVIAAQVVENGDPLLELTVQDSGKGIPQEKLANIFNRFYQVDDSATRQGEGSGIGLALVKELVYLLEGRIEVKSEVGKGSSFLVYLPIHLEAQRDLGGVPSTHPEPLIDEAERVDHAILNSAIANDEKPLVLIIEDNADVTEYIISCLSPNYNLQTARNGKEGLEKALEIIPDVILSDVMMPEMDGFEVCQLLKMDRRSSHIPIVLLTAKATQEDKITGLTHGADAYLTKPFDKEELLIRLSNLAAQSKRLRERLTDPSSHNEAVNETETREAAFLEELNEIIASNLGNELFDTNHLCRAIAMSRAQLHRKLKALTGQATANYIRSFRLRKAKSLLETTDAPIGEIALQVGFKDFSHFSRSFFKEFGVKPSETRK